MFGGYDPRWDDDPRDRQDDDGVIVMMKTR